MSENRRPQGGGVIFLTHTVYYTCMLIVIISIHNVIQKKYYDGHASVGHLYFIYTLYHITVDLYVSACVGGVGVQWREG